MLGKTFIIAINGIVTKGLRCNFCGRSLGTEVYAEGRYESDVEGWGYCPYCAHPLHSEIN